MGEPLPGDFPDPIYVKTANILLKATQVGKAGDYARYDTSGTKAWQVVTIALITAQGPVGGQGIVQLQQDVDSTGFADATVNAGAFGPGSWFYGLATGIINPNDLVVLERFGTLFGFSRNFNIQATSGADSGANAVITLPSGHGLIVGDIVSLKGWLGGGNYNGTFTLTASTATTVTMVNAAVTGAATTAGTIGARVKPAQATAQFIKVSGDTFSDGAVDGDIGVFSMLVGGYATV